MIDDIEAGGPAGPPARPSPEPAPPAVADEQIRAVLEGEGRVTRARIIADLARRFGDLELAEDATQEAFAQALSQWPEQGLPDNPGAWLRVTARRRALDAVRRAAALSERMSRIRAQQELDEEAESVAPVLADDDRLDLLFASSHPVMSASDALALTLRFVTGLSSVEVAHALLVPVATMQQRIVRAKRRLRVLGVPLSVPAPEEIPGRLPRVLRVVSLVYGEGSARMDGEEHISDELTSQALGLARSVHRLVPDDPETAGLLALLLLTEARAMTRVDAQGRPVPLERQDRTRWDAEMMAEGLALAEGAATHPGAGTFTVQAAIAAVHAEAASFAATDWDQIAVLYRLLERHEPGPITRLGRAVALGRARGFAVGLALLDELGADERMARFRPLHIARAVTLTELGRDADAEAAYRRALELPGNRSEDALLLEELAALIS